MTHPSRNFSDIATRCLGSVLIGLASMGFIFVAFVLYLGGEALFGLIALILAVSIAWVYRPGGAAAARFIWPVLAAVSVFVAFPIGYTIFFGFTNYSSFNLLSQSRATEVILSRNVIEPGSERSFVLVADGSSFRLFFADEDGGQLSNPVALDGSELRVATTAVEAPSSSPLPIRDIIERRHAIAALEVVLPDGTVLQSSGLRSFAAVQPEYLKAADGILVSAVDGSILSPDQERGFFVKADGTEVPPGWRVAVGLDNFSRIFASEGIRGPMLRIFMWTVAFAFLSVALCFIVGVMLASVLQWPHLRGKAIYRVLLILPYAVPSFISILIFRGLFNQNFGEINLILDAIFGIRPAWFTDGLLAKTMLVIVNVWLGYPYMMLLAMGYLQSVPEDHRKAAALEGAGPLRIFFSITLPQILPPFAPLLIASFAYNFNNIVLVLLLTRGLPDIPGTLIPAGQTDILGSFTYRIAFEDSGAQFGLAGAITLLIFLVVAAMAWANLFALRRAQSQRIT
jgi:maltose/maltodextrin transport system permease protein